ncbi:A/G-specific adenine glycosylase [Pontibaca methylaminivorans]|uniref:Adenine DNA glycosylase n=1 Tax=Pontibaca methylaminivorans TaxID=515897 RepID=A0A1R3WWU1_9RHOB|nr:A/G-specific adenine glycosylase [Pontibaca methylaminivorans]SIT82154.1 A/G-specific DNA-adenine glycosylase [Pontibaca methylaminivorans]
MCNSRISALLLAWYDDHARTLPWRVGPAARAKGIRPDPYRVWLSEIMLQQTTVAAVRGYFERFTARWPDIHALAAEQEGEVMAQWAGLGYYARARNLLKCARMVVRDHGGRFPDDHAALLALPGIGPYTAAAIAAIAFDRPETVVDGNVERVIARLFDIHAPLPGVKPLLRERAATLTPQQRPGDHAQAMMDLGATICTPRAPACGICPLRGPCAGFRAGDPASLPRRLPKRAKPTRRGTVYIGRREDGAWLLERRGENGMLGGMLGWPGSDWDDPEAAGHVPPAAAEWQLLAEEVRHSFTHFHLILAVQVATLPADARPTRGFFVAGEDFRPADLPTLMRKAHALADEKGPAGNGGAKVGQPETAGARR